MTEQHDVSPHRSPGRIISPEHIGRLKRFCWTLSAEDKRLFLADEIESRLEDFLANDDTVNRETANVLRRIFRGCQEILLDHEYTYLVLRPRIAVRRIYRLHPEQEHLEPVDRFAYLAAKDALVQGWEQASKRGLTLDFSPYFQNFPKVNEPAEMGEGISFLNRHLSGQMYQNPDRFHAALHRFLVGCQLAGTDILVNDYLSRSAALVEAIEEARALLRDYTAETPYHEVSHELRSLGFEPGWGRTVGQAAELLSMLSRLFAAPDPVRFEQFIERLPLVSRVLMVSPHGWFAQDGVLGRPDTGGQVTYVLDQARALERRLLAHFHEAGLENIEPHVAILTRLIPEADGTTCNLPREKVHGAEHSWILRVPFRDGTGQIIPHWISRFQIWPYLEDFAEESKAAVVTEMLGKPDLIIGHYTDGNLVAYRLADDLGVTHCAAVHALEKTKYLLSDTYWSDMEHDYRFSLHFTADLLSYNSADFIISSTYREIGGAETELGMFESYETYSMPGLYRVISGFDPQLARHNIVPPGASEEYFFPNTQANRRADLVRDRLIERFLQADPAPGDVGRLNDPDKPVVFAMARMDKIKNLAGLVDIFGGYEKLREVANLLIVSSLTDASQSSDHEEIAETHRMHETIAGRQLDGHVRWCAARLDKVETGEIYRVVADRRGVFAQPAFMETFGLTVIEAMACGLPVVVTCFGGPSEIVSAGESGEIENPNDIEAFGGALFKTLTDEEHWQSLRKGGIERVKSAYSWSAHAQRMFRLANIYSYWNYVDVMNRRALDQYIHTLYHTVYRPRAQAMIEEGHGG